MNWLAHLFLSEPSGEFRLGNLLPDFVGPGDLRGLPPEIARGVECHRRIDAFTDGHAIVRQSRERIPPPHRRFAGVLVDVFYDHFLAAEWASYSEVRLEDFAREVYLSLAEAGALLPGNVQARFRLRQVREADLLCSYRHLAGVERALARIGARFRKPVDLAAAMTVLEADYDSLRQDFKCFFPELQRHVSSFVEQGAFGNRG